MYSLIIYSELLPFLLQIKISCSKLNRTNASNLVILNCPKMWWKKRDSKVTFSIYDITITAATERILNTWIYYYTKVRCKNKVNAGFENGLKNGFVNNLRITRGRCNGIKFFSNKNTTLNTFHWNFQELLKLLDWD